MRLRRLICWLIGHDKYLFTMPTNGWHCDRCGRELSGNFEVKPTPCPAAPAKAPEPDFDEKRTAPGSYPEELEHDYDGEE